MRDEPVDGPRNLVAAALARAGTFLLEPAPSPQGSRSMALGIRPVVAVVGLASGCGATCVSRAVAAELASRDAGGSAAVYGGGGPRMVSLSTPAAGRLSRALAPLADGQVRSLGRLALIEGGDPAALVEAARYLAPLVIDVGHGEPAGVPVSLADQVLLAARPDVEPALAEVVAESLGRIGPPPLVVLNGAEEGGRWDRRWDAILPESRSAARLALAGREPRGRFGAAVGALADRLAES